MGTTEKLAILRPLAYDKREEKTMLAKQIESLCEGVANPISNLANVSALLWQEFPNINWAGFYIWTNGRLELGPFQGKPACTVIPAGKGVCGTAAGENRTVRVADVHAFPGHIACDSASRSEIVVPIRKNGKVWGVLDMDSPVKDRFSEEDAEILEEAVRTLENTLFPY